MGKLYLEHQDYLSDTLKILKILTGGYWGVGTFY